MALFFQRAFDIATALGKTADANLYNNMFNGN
jgi:hypothetical protein